MWYICVHICNISSIYMLRVFYCVYIHMCIYTYMYIYHISYHISCLNLFSDRVFFKLFFFWSISMKCFYTYLKQETRGICFYISQWLCIFLRFSIIVFIFGSKLLWRNHTFFSLTSLGWMKSRMALELIIPVSMTSLLLSKPSWHLDSLGLPVTHTPSTLCFFFF